MRSIVFTLLVLLALAFYINNASSHVCVSSGDPHYKTFSGYKVNLYGDEGDYLLAQDNKNHLKVMSRIRYGKHWKNRGINSAVAIRVDGNIVEHFGSFYKINGKKNAKLVLKNGSKILVKGARWILTTKSGLVSEFRYTKINNGKSTKFPHYHFTIYVRVPKAYQGRMKGLCGTYKKASLDKKLWKNSKSMKVSQKSRHNLFDRSFKPRKFKKYSKAAWKSKSFHKRAIRFCKKQKLSTRLFKNCLFDIKISGRFSLSKNYGKIAADKKKLRKISKKERKISKKIDLKKCVKVRMCKKVIITRKQFLKKRREFLRALKRSQKRRVQRRRLQKTTVQMEDYPIRRTRSSHLVRR